jgi:hypothetical protein
LRRICRQSVLALPLLVLGIRADDSHDAFAMNDFAIVANLFN